MKRLLPLLLMLLLALFAAVSWKLVRLNQQLRVLQQQNATLSAGIVSRDVTLSQMQEENGQREKSELALRQALIDAGDPGLKRQLTMNRMIDRDEALRHWSTAALPDGIIRLQQRPAFTSARDYLAWLSQGQQLPDPRQPERDSGDLLADIRQLEQALLLCGLQIETIKQCQEQHDVKANPVTRRSAGPGAAAANRSAAADAHP